MTIEKVLGERKNTHGNFIDTCVVTQALVQQLYVGSNYSTMHPAQAESLHMICHKMARIVCGDPNFADHWVDIEGYANLVINKLLATSNMRALQEVATQAKLDPKKK